MLITIGNIYDRFYSVSGISTTTDAVVWSATLAGPFAAHVRATSLGGVQGLYAVGSSVGTAAVSNDLVHWRTGVISSDGNFIANNITRANGVFLAAGMHKYNSVNGPYQPLDEAAEIYSSASAEPNTWRLIFSEFNPHSVFYNIRYTNTVWIAVGSANGVGIIHYSLDNGFSWNRTSVPAYTTAVTDVVFYNGVYYFSANGMIIYTTSLSKPTWQRSSTLDHDRNNTITAIASNSMGQLVAVNSHGIYSSQDLLTWSAFSIRGYNFKNAVFYNNRWTVGCYTNLTEYTYFYSTDSINWYGNNNTIHDQTFLIV